MNLERDLADAEFSRRLLVEKAAYHEGQDFPFPRGQGGKALLQRGEPGPVSIALHGPARWRYGSLPTGPIR